MLIELTLTPLYIGDGQSFWEDPVAATFGPRPGVVLHWQFSRGIQMWQCVTEGEGLKNTKMWYNYLNGPLFGLLICGCDTLNNIGTDRIVFTCNFDSILSHRAKIIRRLCTLHPKPFFPSVVNLWYRHLTTPTILQYVYCNHNPSYLENLTVYLMLSNAKALK